MSCDDPLFVGEDLRLIESLVYRPELKPSYEFMKDCLVWEDERPDGLTPDDYSNLSDLLVARSYLHRGEPFSAWELDPDRFKSVWERAIKQGLRWPGFRRVSLSGEEEAYYRAARAEEL
jgi:hypothetical protein